MHVHDDMLSGLGSKIGQLVEAVVGDAKTADDALSTALSADKKLMQLQNVRDTKHRGLNDKALYCLAISISQITEAKFTHHKHLANVILLALKMKNTISQTLHHALTGP